MCNLTEAPFFIISWGHFFFSSNSAVTLLHSQRTPQKRVFWGDPGARNNNIHKKSQKITTNHNKSHKITQNKYKKSQKKNSIHNKSQKITKITKNHKQKILFTKNHTKSQKNKSYSQKITSNHKKKILFTKNHKQSQKITKSGCDFL